MPELPEVETTCLGIKPHIVGQTVSQVVVREKRLRWPIANNLNAKLSAQTVIDVSRRAKYICIQTSEGFLIIHLGMSGTVRIVSKEADIKKHDHFDCVFKNGNILRFNDPRRFGAILWTSHLNDLKIIADLGPEPLESGFNACYLFESSQRRRIPIKDFIMNNRIVVGVGNIYASESLYLAAIHPQMPSNQLSYKQAGDLVKAIQKTLKKAIAKGGTTLKDFYQSDGKPGYFKNDLKVYGRKDLPCFRCNNPIETIRMSQRATYYCSECQK